MFAIEDPRRLRRFPLVMLLGLALMATGGVLDVVVHFGPLDHHAHEAFVSEHGAHVVGIAGMAFVLVGVVTHGVRHHRRRRAATLGGFESNAHR